LDSLLFIAPPLAAYEIGVLTLGVQNGADAWMRGVLNSMGFGQHFLLPLLTVAILLGWHHLAHQRWRLSAGVLLAMAAECVLLAVCLWLILRLQGSLLQAVADPVPLSIATRCKDAVLFLGAGIYEELLFRLILLSLVMWLLRRVGAAAPTSMCAAVLLTSILFSAAHYGNNGDSFHWFSFLFRCLAGVFFSILFVYRGFGIAAGTHAAYDVLVGLY
jgi:membrane protease YdiL (CAAX protease family)